MVTDNDGDYAKKVDAKYKPYDSHGFISIHRSTDNTLKTMEPQLVAANELDVLNRALGKTFGSKADAEAYMTDHKTDAALALHDTTEALVMPAYIQEAINGLGQ